MKVQLGYCTGGARRLFWKFDNEIHNNIIRNETGNQCPAFELFCLTGINLRISKQPMSTHMEALVVVTILVVVAQKYS